MHLQQSNTRYEPNSEFDMAGRFVPKVDVTHDDEDTKFSHADFPLQLPASANAAFENWALVTFSQVEGDVVRNFSKSPSETDSGCVESLQITVSQIHTLKVHLQFLDLEKLFNW